MSYSKEKSDIEGYFASNWPYTPVVFENGISMEADEWVRLTIQHGPARQVSMGDNPTFRHIGFVHVQIYTKTNVGSGRAIELADLVDGLFRNLVLADLRFKVPQIRVAPYDTRINQRPEWYQVNVSTEFYRGF